MNETNEQQDPKPAPGYYEAKIINYGIKKTKKGDPAPVIIFNAETEEGKQHVFWSGSLNDGKARDITLKTLAICGFRNVSAFPYLAEGPSSGLLNMEKEVQITVEHESVEEVDKKTGEKIIRKYAKVRWINESGGGRFKEAIDVQHAKVLMMNMGLEADFLRIASENGYETKSELVKPSAIHSEDIPF